MQLGKIRRPTGETQVAVIREGRAHLVDLRGHAEFRSLSAILHAADPRGVLEDLIAKATQSIPVSEASFAAPSDAQEVWAAGVTYKRSREARQRESVGAARFYDLVYTAPRPELFFKGTPHRVAGPSERVRIRRDSRWSVPEPELALVVSPRLHIAGYTIGNDMSARDIEGENPLYLPQAKVYDRSCALGPVVTLKESMPPLAEVAVTMSIARQGKNVFEGRTHLSQMARTFEDLVQWLGRDNSFPNGVILLTGTGIVPPDDFTLASGDRIEIYISGIGTLANVVE